uniref:Uncharacterized protein n=1 Tax=Rhizophora mucronata TaxID=61149 RepID=A0A2P2LHA0_RHIMU
MSLNHKVYAMVVHCILMFLETYRYPIAVFLLSQFICCLG